ncbi:MAG: hypothetical protein ACKPKO_43550, partial [Candidatus Fonsibacter sp.]
EPRRSTLFVPGDLARIEAPAQIINSACPCVKGAKFANWLHYDCGIGHVVVSNITTFDNMEQVIPVVLHALKFRLLNACRTSPI